MGLQRLGPVRWIVAFLVLVLCVDRADATSRFIQPLDGGESVTVDNASSFSDAWIGSRVLTADRSTQDDCVYSPPDLGGLMQLGDRVCVTDHYIAWFDYTRNDGVPFGPPFDADWDRSGALAGLWTLDPELGDFRYYRVGPNGCTWPRNELMPGSASPNQEQNWWDRYAPPNEHSIQIVSGSERYFFSYYKAKASPNSNFIVEVDGATDGAGDVHYKTSARMTSLDNQVDTSDNNDDNGIESTIEAELEYVCRPTEILSRWSFRPSTTEVTDNMFVYLWVGYAQDIDDTPCDVAPGSQWPDVVYGMNLYTVSSLPLIVPYPPWDVPPGSVVEMELGEICSGINIDLQSHPYFQVEKGSWIAFGEAPDLGADAPRLRYVSLDEPNAGTGTYQDPHRIDWQRLLTWNETHDGTIGIGASRGPFTDPGDFKTLAPEWYRSEFIVSIRVHEVFDDGFESGDTTAWSGAVP
jgi:hypothetical protein